MAKKYYMFISYSREDEHFVRPIVQLFKLSKRRVFLDAVDINPGEIWKESLQKSIRSSQTILLLWCCHSAASRWVANEINLAFKERKVLAPVMLCSSPMPKLLSEFQWIDFSSLVSHECVTHVDAPSPYIHPLWRFNLTALEYELGVDLSNPRTVDEAWARIVKSSTPRILNFRVLAGTLLLALWIIRPFPSPFPPSITSPVNIAVALLGIFTMLSGLLRGWPAVRAFFPALFREPVAIDQQAKLVALAIHGVFARLSRMDAL
jgi:hypothetical protein